MNATTGNALTVLFDMIAMNPEKNVLPRLTVSVKKAVLSLALERCNADKDFICSLLGLTGRQYDDAMYATGLGLMVADMHALEDGNE